MCELFGISSKEECEINDYLKVFYSRSDQHPDGWGLACMEENRVSVEKEPIQASKSHYLKERLSVPILAKTAFAHIRYATIGNVEYKNCHPYVLKDMSGRTWTMIHNGTIFDYEPLNKYLYIQRGDTDSERILLYIINCIDKKERELKKRLGSRERFELLNDIIMDMAKGNKLNLLISDGELIYVHTNYADSLYERAEKDRTFFSTSPLDGTGWKPVKFTTLLAYQSGKQLFQGTDHGNEYVENEENVKLLYNIFSNL